MKLTSDIKFYLNILKYFQQLIHIKTLSLLNMSLFTLSFWKPVCTITLMEHLILDKPHVKGSIAIGSQRFLHWAIIVLYFVSDSIPPERTPSLFCPLGETIPREDDGAIWPLLSYGLVFIVLEGWQWWGPRKWIWSYEDERAE